MLIKCFGILEEYPEVTLDVEVSSIREILSCLDFTYGKQFVETLINNPFYYVLSDSKKEKESIVLVGEMLATDYTGYDTMFILPELSGEITAAVVGAVIAVSEVAATVIAVAINIALSIGLNMLMSSLSPTPEFSSDPAYSQNKSNLFNGAPILKEQGGSVPLVFGNPWCGAVLISSGVFSEEI